MPQREIGYTDDEGVYIEVTVEGVTRRAAFDPAESTSGDTMDRPGIVDAHTRELIGQKFREKGADALGELDTIEANANVPAEVTAYLQDTLAMQYLTYVALTGDRVTAVEGRLF